MDTPEIKVKRYELSKEKIEKGITITEQKQEQKMKKPKFLSDWTLENNLTDIAFGLRNLLHKKSFVLDNTCYQIMIPSQLSQIAGTFSHLVSLSLNSFNNPSYNLSSPVLSLQSSSSKKSSSDSFSSSLSSPKKKAINITTNGILTSFTNQEEKNSNRSTEGDKEKEEKETKVSEEDSSSADSSPRLSSSPTPSKKGKLLVTSHQLNSGSSHNLLQFINQSK